MILLQIIVFLTNLRQYGQCIFDLLFASKFQLFGERFILQCAAFVSYAANTPVLFKQYIFHVTLISVRSKVHGSSLEMNIMKDESNI